jgi:hypothetical protein
VERGAQLKPQRDDLFEREGAVLPYERREPRTLEELKNEMGARAVENRVEAPQQHRMLECLQVALLGGEPP